MAGLKERVIDFLREGLTMTPEQRAFMLFAPGGLTCIGLLFAEIGKKDAIKDEKDNKPAIETG